MLIDNIVIYLPFRYFYRSIKLECGTSLNVKCTQTLTEIFTQHWSPCAFPLLHHYLKHPMSVVVLLVHEPVLLHTLPSQL